MVLGLLPLLLSSLLALPGEAGTPLVAGDVAVVAYNADAPDGFAWVALYEIPAGTSLYFTDSSVSNGCFYWVEHLAAGPQSMGRGGPLAWSHTDPLPAGTVVRFSSETAAWSVGTASGAYPYLGTSGDQLFIYTGPITRNAALPGGYEGDPSAAAMLYGLNFGNSGWTNAPGAHVSGIPAGLSVAQWTAAHVDGRDNGYYAGPTTGSVSELLRNLAAATNWVTHDATLATNDWPRSFHVLPGTPFFEFSRSPEPRQSAPRFPQGPAGKPPAAANRGRDATEAERRLISTLTPAGAVALEAGRMQSDAGCTKQVHVRFCATHRLPMVYDNESPATAPHRFTRLTTPQGHPAADRSHGNLPLAFLRPSPPPRDRQTSP